MAAPTYTKISSQIAAQFPEFIQSEGPRFVEFLKGYYEQAEQTGEVVHAARSIITNQDVDTATAYLLAYFRKEFLSSVPLDTLADPRLIIKHIRSFYRARGSADAYRFLFRMLFGTEIDFYYPGEDILRCSDGRWVTETILSVGGPLTGNPLSWEGDIVSGGTSGARGRVESVTKSLYQGVEAFELTLSSVFGDFTGEELITNLSDGSTATVNTTSGPLSNASITSEGAFHQNDDLLTFTEPLSTGIGAEGTVSQTNDLSALTFKIIRGGKGYRTTSRIVIGPSTGHGARFSITGLANTENILLNSDLIGSVKNVVLNTGPVFPSLGANSTTLSANLAAANISSTLLPGLLFTNNVIGRIQQITLVDPGTGYNRLVANGLPTVTVIDDEISDIELPDGYGGIKGRDAVIIANNAPGALTAFLLTKRGQAYNKNEIVRIDNATKGVGVVDETTTDAQQTGLAVVLRRQASYSANAGSIPGGTTVRVGRYTDTRGWLSWNNRLQDNEYYQEFSYAIVAPVLFTLFESPVKAMVHPAGTKVFGTYTITETLDLTPTFDNHTYIEIPLTIDFPTIVGYLDVTGGDISLIEFENASVADLFGLVDAVSDGETWTDMAGTIHIRELSIILPFAAVLNKDFANCHIDLFTSGSNTAIFGLGTTFAGSLTPVPGDTIIIVATSEATANGLYTVTRVANNTFMEVAPPYNGNLLANGYVRF